jgi:hypothetical protein
MKSSRIARNAAANKMHAVNLAIVFGMALSPNTSHPFGISPDLGLYQTMVKTWISYADQIFPDVEGDEIAPSVIQTDSAGVHSLPASPLPAALHIESSTLPKTNLDELVQLQQRGVDGELTDIDLPFSKPVYSSGGFQELNE